MFDVPNAKSVRRSELDSPASSRASSPENGASSAAQAKLAAYFSNMYADPTPAQPSTHSDEKADETETPDDEAAEDREEGYAFRLFGGPSGTSSKSKAAKPTKIIIRSSTPDKEGGILVSRSKDYYLAKPWSAEHCQAAASIICTPESIFAEAARRWKGCELPWRIRRLEITKKQAVALEQNGTPAEGCLDGEMPAPKKRPGKKRRIVLRKRAKAKIERAEKAKVEAAERDAAEREKRTKRNREKKVKKKLRDKAKKETEAVGEARPDDVSEDS